MQTSRREVDFGHRFPLFVGFPLFSSTFPECHERSAMKFVLRVVGWISKAEEAMAIASSSFRRAAVCCTGFRCAYHGWRFDSDGKCLSIPQSESGGRDEAQVAACPKVYPTHVRRHERLCMADSCTSKSAVQCLFNETTPRRAIHPDTELSYSSSTYTIVREKSFAPAVAARSRTY